jgi:hypothetical protein
LQNVVDAIAWDIDNKGCIVVNHKILVKRFGCSRLILPAKDGLVYGV